MKAYKKYICGHNDRDRRLDRILKKILSDVPAGLIYSGLRKGLIKVNGKKRPQSYRVEENDLIEISEIIKSDHKRNTKTEQNTKAADFLQSITVTKSDNLLFLNKPAGLLTHGDDSLADYLKTGLTDIDSSLAFTPAPLHRLDRNTSGLITASLTIDGAKHFSELMRQRKIKKYYIGLCLGKINNTIYLEDNLIRKNKKTYKSEKINGLRAKTTISPILSKNNLTLCLFNIETGVTHQIRSQCSEKGYPLAGDVKYGGKFNGINNYFLHSYKMIFPENDKICGVSEVTAELPSPLIKTVKKYIDASPVDIINKTTNLFNNLKN
ncbi:MAG: RluA family pseudouridine synthase [Spirochaetales bacterium]|nr:RluA family pseudouridine synthase [Spirochaetales bacterium]